MDEQTRCDGERYNRPTRCRLCNDGSDPETRRSANEKIQNADGKQRQWLQRREGKKWRTWSISEVERTEGGSEDLGFRRRERGGG